MGTILVGSDKVYAFDLQGHGKPLANIEVPAGHRVTNLLDRAQGITAVVRTAGSPGPAIVIGDLSHRPRKLGDTFNILPGDPSNMVWLVDGGRAKRIDLENEAKPVEINLPAGKLALGGSPDGVIVGEDTGAPGPIVAIGHNNKESGIATRGQLLGSDGERAAYTDLDACLPPGCGLMVRHKGHGTRIETPVGYQPDPGAVFSPDGKLLAVWGQQAGQRTLMLVDLESRKATLTSAVQPIEGGAPPTVIHRSGKFVVFRHGKDSIGVLDREKNEVTVLAAQVPGIDSLALSDSCPSQSAGGGGGATT